MKREANNFENQLENTRDLLVAAEEKNEKLKQDICKLLFYPKTTNQT